MDFSKTLKEAIDKYGAIMGVSTEDEFEKKFEKKFETEGMKDLCFLKFLWKYVKYKTIKRIKKYSLNNRDTDIIKWNCEQSMEIICDKIYPELYDIIKFGIYLDKNQRSPFSHRYSGYNHGYETVLFITRLKTEFFTTEFPNLIHDEYLFNIINYNTCSCRYSNGSMIKINNISYIDISYTWRDTKGLINEQLETVKSLYLKYLIIKDEYEYYINEISHIYDKFNEIA